MSVGRNKCDGHRPPLQFLFAHDYFHFNFLKGKLIMNHAEQLESARVGHVRATNFYTHRFTNELRVRFGHFAVEEK